MSSSVRFDEFELSLGTGELRRDGQPVLIKAQAARLLCHLVVASVALAIATVAMWLALRPGEPVLPTVAVLPFEGADADARILGASLADELARELTVAGGRPLRVIGREIFAPNYVDHMPIMQSLDGAGLLQSVEAETHFWRVVDGKITEHHGNVSMFEIHKMIGSHDLHSTLV